MEFSELLLMFTLLITVVRGSQVKICQPTNCLNNNCSKVPCYSGDCTDSGFCLCSPCWTGRSCDGYKNEHYPVFDEKNYHIVLTNQRSAGDVITTVHASDPDTQLTCSSLTGSGGSCDCGHIIYTIESGNEMGWFQIDKDSGVVSLAADIDPASVRLRNEVSLYLTTSNVEVEGKRGDVVGPKNYATLRIRLGEERPELLAAQGHSYPEDKPNDEWGGVNDLDEVHSRKRRSLANPVSNVTFTLIKTGNYNFTTVMFVGSKIHFQLQIEFPPGTSDLLVELFTPDNDTTVMVICAPTIAYSGPNLQYDKMAAQPVVESKDGSTNYDRAILNFGNVTNTQSYANMDNDSMIFIEWDAVMIDNGQTVNGSVYWVSAGAEYNEANDIWIGQAGFTTILDNYNDSVTGQIPTFNMSGPSTANIGTSTVFQVDMFMPYPVTDLVFEAFTPMNYTDAMTACSAMVVGVGVNYECLDFSKITYTLYPSDSGLTNERVRMNIGHVINKGSRDNGSWADHRISMQFTMYMPYNESLIGAAMYVGATMEIGTNQIWAGQILVNVANITASTFPDVLPFNRTGIRDAAVNSFGIVEYNMTTANDTDGNYLLTVTVPVGQFRICSVAINYQGVNVPCLRGNPPVYSATDGVSAYNQAVWDLGRIKNTAGRYLYLDPQANTVQFYITVEVLSATTAYPVNGNVPVTIQMNYGGAGQQDGPSPAFFKIIPTPVGLAATNATGPFSSFTMMNGTGMAFVNSSSDLRLRVSTVRGYMYEPFQVSFAMPTTGLLPQFSICRAELLSVGKNMPCVNRTAVNSSVAYYALSPGTPNYLAVFNLSSVCNNGPTVNGTYNQSATDDMMEFSVIVHVENNVGLTNGSTPVVDAIISFGTGLTWVYTYAPQVYSPQMVTYVGQVPFIEVPRLGVGNMTTNTSVSQAPPAGLVSFQIIVKTPPESVADWSFIADVSGDPALSVCSISVVEVGYGVACVDKTTLMRDYLKTDGTGIGRGVLELYKVSNVGSNRLYMDDIFDNNSLIITVVVQVANTAVQGSTHNVWLGVDYGMDGVDQSNNMSVVIGAPALPGLDPNAIKPNYTLYNTPVNDNDTLYVPDTIYPGETVIITAELGIPLNGRVSVQAEFVVNPPGMLDINEAHVVFVGANIPCLRKKMITANITYGPTGTGDRVWVDLGQVCQFPLTPNIEDDQLRIELIATLRPDATTLNTPATIKVESYLTFNTTAQTMVPLVYNFISAPPLPEIPNYLTMGMADIKVNVTPGSVTNLAPYDFYTVFLDVTVPANCSVFGVVDVNTPLGSLSAVATVMDIAVVYYGRNLGRILNPRVLKTVYNSSFQTSQNDNAFIDLGKLTNTGHTYRADIFEPGDDDIRLLVTIQMADALEANSLVNFDVSFGAKLGTPIVFDNMTISTTRTPPDVPSIDLELYGDSTVTYSPGSTIVLNGQIKHNNLSRAEGIATVDIQIFIPKYVWVNVAVTTTFIGTPAPILSNISFSNGFVITLPHLYFTDIVNFTVNLFIVGVKNPPTNTPPATVELSTISSQVVFDITPRTNMIISNKDIITPMTSLNLTILPTRISACVPGALTGLIGCQISGSVTTTNYGAPQAISGTTTGWRPAIRYGPFPSYIQVNFQKLTTIKGVTITQVGNTGSDIKSFVLQYSNDAINWVDGQIVTTVLFGTPMGVTAPMDAVFVRLQVLSFTVPSIQPEVQVQFQGCSAELMPTLCVARNGYNEIPATQGDFYPRGFLSDGTNMYFCDSMPKEDYSQCYTSSDGTLFKGIDQSVVNVVGFYTTTSQLFGIDWNKKAVVTSLDAGKTWYTISPTDYSNFKADTTNFKSYTQVPLDGSTTATYTSANWGAGYYGLYSPIGSSPPLADWSQCCQ